MAIQHTVASGETVSQIAKRYNVPISSVSGYRSNDANTIFPGENLSINDGLAQNPTPQVPAPQATAPQQTPQQLAAAIPPAGQSINPSAPAPAPQPVSVPPPAGQSKQINSNLIRGAFNTPADQVPQSPLPVQSPGAIPAPQDIQEPSFNGVQGSTGLPEDFFSSGGDTQELAVPKTPQELQADNLFQQFGFSGDQVAEGFKISPVQTLSEIASEVMTNLNLPDNRNQIENIAGEIEDIGNQRDQEMASIQDDPFKSQGTKDRLKQKVADRYELRIANRQNRLTLMQNAYDSARQQAQFALQTALSIYGQQQDQANTDIERILNERERVLEAQAKGGVGGEGGTTPEVSGWVQLIQSGQADITNVPSDIRSAVASGLAQSPQSSAQTPAQVRGSKQATVAIENIDQALSTIDKVFGGAFGRAFGPIVPGSDARDLSQQVKTVNALIGFDQLQKMREASPTGGALGQVSERELAFLQSVEGSLDVGQSETQLRGNLNRIKASFEKLRALSNPNTTFEEYLSVYPNATDQELKEVLMRQSGGGQSFNQVGGDTNQASKVANAIAQVESGGKYSAVGPKTAKGNRAYGKYQIMDFNIPAWSKEFLGRTVTVQEFLNSPQIQDTIAQGKIQQLYDQYGNPNDVASVWFSGRPMAKAGQSSDITGTTVPEYIKRVNRYLT